MRRISVQMKTSFVAGAVCILACISDLRQPRCMPARCAVCWLAGVCDVTELCSREAPVLSIKAFFSLLALRLCVFLRSFRVADNTRTPRHYTQKTILNIHFDDQSGARAVVFLMTPAPAPAPAPSRDNGSGRSISGSDIETLFRSTSMSCFDCIWLVEMDKLIQETQARRFTPSQATVQWSAFGLRTQWSVDL